TGPAPPDARLEQRFRVAPATQGAVEEHLPGPGREQIDGLTAQNGAVVKGLHGWRLHAARCLGPAEYPLLAAPRGPGTRDGHLRERLLGSAAERQVRSTRRLEDVRDVRVADRDHQIAAARPQLLPARQDLGNARVVEVRDLAQVEHDASRIERSALDRVVDRPERLAIQLAANGDGRLRPI